MFCTVREAGTLREAETPNQWGWSTDMVRKVGEGEGEGVVGEGRGDSAWRRPERKVHAGWHKSQAQAFHLGPGNGKDIAVTVRYGTVRYGTYRAVWSVLSTVPDNSQVRGLERMDWMDWMESLSLA
jgi:hypothetical protein